MAVDHQNENYVVTVAASLNEMDEIGEFNQELHTAAKQEIAAHAIQLAGGGDRPVSDFAPQAIADNRSDEPPGGGEWEYRKTFSVPMADVEVGEEEVADDVPLEEQDHDTGTEAQMREQCPSGPSFAQVGEYYEVTVVLKNLTARELRGTGLFRQMAEAQMAKQVAKAFNPDVDTSQFLSTFATEGFEDADSGYYVGPGLRKGPAVRFTSAWGVPYNRPDGAQDYCRTWDPTVRATKSYTESWRIPISSISNVDIMPTGLPDADATDDAPPDAEADAAGAGAGEPGTEGHGQEDDEETTDPSASDGGDSSTSDNPEEEEEEEEEISLEPLDYQCVLLGKIMKLKDQHQELSGPYQKLITVDTNADPGDTLSIINHGGQSAAVREMLSLCPDVHALLTPYIKVSRVDYDKTTGKPTGKEAPLSIPNFISEKDVAKILSGDSGRIPGAGIKSFSWALEGVQPEEVDNNITATLVVWFQSVGDFFAGAAQAGQTTGPDGTGDPIPNFLDLIINSPGTRGEGKKKTGANPSKKPSKAPCENSSQSRKYEGANFRIKVVAGWATPPNLEAIYPELAQDSPLDKTKTRAETLRDALQATRVSLFLQQTRHNIDFKENGSLQLTVNYQASLTGILTGANSDIFAPGEGANSIATKREKLDQLKSDDADRKRNSQEEKNKEAIDDILKEIKKLEEADKLEKWRKLLAKIYEADKVYHIEIPAGELLESKQQFKLSEEDRLERAREKQGTAVTVSKTSDYESELVGEIAKGKASKEEKKRKKKEKKSGKKIAGSDELITIDFMYLGDMIDSIMLQIDANNGDKPLDFSFFLSETQFIDGEAAATIEDIDVHAQCGDLRDAFYRQKLEQSGAGNLSSIYKIINIGDIPISIRSFQNWYVKNVVDKDRDKYFLLHFIKDLTSQLITNALRGQCFGKNLKLFQRFDVQPLSLNKKGQAAPIVKGSGCVSIGAVAKAQGALTGETSLKDIALGMILISTDTNPSNLRANFDEDLERGIYHQYIGSACSLLKNLTFKREDMPYLRESKIQKVGALGPEQLRELYSVSVDMVGNNLYKNGTYIYVSPLLINTDREQLDYLGLHGYYLVTSVKSEVTEQNFKTSITALQEGIEFKHNGPAPPTVQSDDACAAPSTAPSPSSNPES